MKAETELSRRTNQISSIGEFFNRVTTSYANPNQKNDPKNLSPSPLVNMTYNQFLIDASKLYNKIENRFYVLEADSYI